MRIVIASILFLLTNHLAAQFMPTSGNMDIKKTPERQWKFTTGGPITGSPVIDNNTVYIGSHDSILYALDLKTGKEKWRFRTGGAIRNSVAIIGNLLFLLSTDGILYRLDADSGRINGFYQTMTGYTGDRQHDPWDYFTSTPVIADSVIYFGAGEDLYAITVNDGYLLWTYKTGDVVHTSPAINKNRVFAGSFDGHIYALNRSTGVLDWKFKTNGRFTFPKGEASGNPVVASGILFAGARDNGLYALDVRGGYCNWVKSFDYGWALSVTPGDSVLYVGTSDDQTLFALDPRSGREYWKTPVGFNIFGGVVKGTNMGYFGTLAGKLIGIDLRKGKVQWVVETDAWKANHLSWFNDQDALREDAGIRLRTPYDVLKMYRDLGGIFGTPAMTGDRIVVAGYDGGVYCYSSGL